MPKDVCDPSDWPEPVWIPCLDDSVFWYAYSKEKYYPGGVNTLKEAVDLLRKETKTFVMIALHPKPKTDYWALIRTKADGDIYISPVYPSDTRALIAEWFVANA